MQCLGEHKNTARVIKLTASRLCSTAVFCWVDICTVTLPITWASDCACHCATASRWLLHSMCYCILLPNFFQLLNPVFRNTDSAYALAGWKWWQTKQKTASWTAEYSMVGNFLYQWLLNERTVLPTWVLLNDVNIGWTGRSVAEELMSNTDAVYIYIWQCFRFCIWPRCSCCCAGSGLNSCWTSSGWLLIRHRCSCCHWGGRDSRCYQTDILIINIIRTAADITKNNRPITVSWTNNDRCGTTFFQYVYSNIIQ